LLDTLGRLKIPFKYYNIVPFNSGYAIGRIKDDLFILRPDGQATPVEDKSIIDIKRFQENLAPYNSTNGKMGVVDPQGKIIIEPQFERIGHFSNGLAWARNDSGLFGFVDTSGTWVHQPTFLAVKDFDIESGMALVKTVVKSHEVVDGIKQVIESAKWSNLNMKGEIKNYEIEGMVKEFSEGLLMGKKNDFVGFINTEGEWVIKPQFEGAKDFKNGFACAKQNGLWGLIDKTGNWVITPRFDHIADVAKLR
jgi:WG containing repeat